MAVNGVEIQVRQVWRNRGGSYVEITEHHLRLLYPWVDNTGRRYSGKGAFDLGGPTVYDLLHVVAGADANQLGTAALTAHKVPVPVTAAGIIIGTDTSTGVGDINSSAKGSGARFNTGKVPYDLVPIELMARYWDHVYEGGLDEYEEVDVSQALWSVGEFQARRTEACLIDVLMALGDGWEDCARVFDYGRGKYKEFNWAKGMAWSIPIACATRHLLAMIKGEELDPESGLPHRGHVYCNICMLLTFEETFPEGDDRPVDGALADNEAYFG